MYEWTARELSRTTDMGKLLNGSVGLVALAFVLASVACNHVAHTNLGMIDLTVTVPVKAQVDELAYVVTGNGLTPLAGHVQSARPQEVFDELIANIPAGDGYHLAISAKSIDKKLMCSRETIVSVRKGAITRVHLDLDCVSIGDGTVVIAVAVACTPGVHLVSYSVAPLSASIGGEINLVATALDADAGTLSYVWSAPTGSFADPSAAQTTYLCTTPGHVTLDLVAAGAVCQESQDIEVDCLGTEGTASKDASVDSPAGP